MADSAATRNASYGQILKSASVIGGSAAAGLVIGLARVKIVALILGPAGIGLVGLYQSSLAVLGIAAGLGLSASGVREVAEANGLNDAAALTGTVYVLRRVCWITGALGWVMACALAVPLSHWTFGSPDYAGAIAILGCTLTFAAIAGGQTALLEGTRRIGDLARISIAGSLAGAVVAIGLYLWLRERGVVPVIIATSGVNLLISWYYARRVPLPPAPEVTRAEGWKITRRLLGLGVALMWAGLFATATTLATSSLIVRLLGLGANGLYTAAWNLSGVFAGFILNAMGTDFYPRLTAAAHDHAEANRLVNEQTEIGILLALPGLLGTLVFAPLAMRLFYSSRFEASAALLPWFIVGIFGRVTSWPLGYIMLAQGKGRLFAITEMASGAIHLTLIYSFMKMFGLIGVALAFATLYLIYNVGMVAVARRLTGMEWSGQVWRLIALSCAAVAACVSCKALPEPFASAGGAAVIAASSGYCLRQLSARVGMEHRLVVALTRLPGMRFLLGFDAVRTETLAP